MTGVGALTIEWPGASLADSSVGAYRYALNAGDRIYAHMENTSTTGARNRGTYMTLNQAAQDTGMSVRTLRRNIAQGKLTAYRVGRTIRLKAADIDAMFTPTTQWNGGAK